MSDKMSWHTPSTDLGAHICMKLINLVKQYPILYTSSRESVPHPRKNRYEINQIWENIARDIGLSVNDCKRRWKGLKDVYAKIRKRRLQEGVMGINARKKWLYEDVMSFMKFPFEKPYQKALENFQEVDCNEWRIEDAESNDTIEDTLNDSNDHSALPDSKFKEDELQIDEQEDQNEIGATEYLDLDLEVDSVPDTEGYEFAEVSKKEVITKIEKKAQVSTQEKYSRTNAETIIGSKYRAIRPKPYQPNLLTKKRIVINGNVRAKNNTSSRTSTVSNVSNFDPLNEVIVQSPTLRSCKNFNAVIPASSNIEVKSYGKEASDGVSSTSMMATKLNSSKNIRVNSGIVSKKVESPLRMNARKSSSTSSVELFFQSMAHTVMNLPMRAQAEIKMEICKVVTRAEIQHSLTQSTTNLESHESKSKKG